MKSNDITKKHRVIGIRHTLKKLKDEGLIDDESFYPDDAVDDVRDEIISVARRWYRIGARRGALEILDAILNGEIKVTHEEDNTITLNTGHDAVTWERGLRIRTGNKMKKVKKKTYQLSIDKLGFE